MDGKRTKEIEGERISEGSGDWRSVGMRDWSISIAILSGKAQVSSWRELMLVMHPQLSQKLNWAERHWTEGGKGRILFPKFNVRSSTGFLSLSPPFLSPGSSSDLWGGDESNHVSPSLFVLTFARNALCTWLPRPFAVMGSLVANGRVRKPDFHIPPNWGYQLLPQKQRVTGGKEDGS